MTDTPPSPSQPVGDISIWNHLKAIGSDLRPMVATIPRFLKRNLIYTRFGRYILIPLILLTVGRIVVNLSPTLLPGCAEPASSTCEASKATEHDITLDTLLFVLGLLAATGLERYGLRDLFSHARKIAHEAQRHPFLAKLGETRFEQTYGLLSGLAHTSYTVASSEAMHEWFADFFTESPRRYRGVDTHLPSDYLQKYKWYLVEHGESLKKRAESKDKSLHSLPNDVRILAVDQDQLGNDYIDNEKLYREFVKWHTKNNVDVYWMPRREVRRLCKKYHIETSDVGLWDDYGVFFKNLAEGKVELSMRFKGAPSRAKLSYSEVNAFMDHIVADAKLLTEIPPDLDIFGGALAERWEDYVDPVKRSEVLGPFLDSILANHPLVLDAAAGIGCESIYLLKQQEQMFSVYSNEVDARFATIAQERARRANVSLNLTKYRWEGLPAALEGNMRFNSALVLGNSLCMVLNKERRRRCLSAFFEILRPGGIIVIDERNFQYILDNRAAILADPYQALKFVREGDVMYHGHGLRAYPVAVADNVITWTFFDNEPTVESGADLSTRRIPDSDLQLYPFKHGELYRLLADAGFVDIDVYADLQLIGEGKGESSTMPSLEAIGDSAFITYVGRRPK